jgi:precorrin-2 dehydrogenase / sirohydrochlorin ferrochelatase
VSYYPMFLDLRGMPCLVVGGGSIAHGKIVGLLRAGATVQVVAPSVDETVATLARRGEVTVVTRPYAAEDVRGFQLVVAATDQPEVNRRVSSDARQAGALVNVVDSPELSQFIAPAVLERGDVQVAVSTSGRSPAFAVFVRDRIGDLIGPEFATALTILARVRERVRTRSMDDRRRIQRAIAEGGLTDRVRRRDHAGIDGLLRAALGEGATLRDLGVEL